ncbi:heterokaryon incompatibility protein-domain-containing protein, partial [Lasiosphaeris hirsuta]
AARWLAGCRAGHSKCRRGLSAGGGFVPTRLLAIGGGKGVGSMILCEGLGVPVVYAALSHRWSAETEAVRLTRAGLVTRMTEGILVSALPLLMRDAITALRDLGIGYVWIDSLCIVQDSVEDWRAEAAMMAQVYSNAELTIAATWCSGGRQSLFSARDSHEFAPARLWPLLGRGWVYQEQWLSRRILHFTQHELVWVCNETTACECGRNQFGVAPSTFEVSCRPSRWEDMVHEYSSRAFTQMTDRLPALAGIATVYSSECDTPPGRYLCGLWSEDLPGALFWRAARDAPLLPRSKTKMPSWSWASSAGPVEFEYTDGEVQKTKVLAVHVSYRGKEVMGDVTEAVLHISGPV